MYGAIMGDRLTKSDWIRHGLRTLAREGPSALRAEPMAAKLKVSRGSFYWHFRDIGDFRSQLLQSWREAATDEVIRDLDARWTGRDRLTNLIRQAFGGRRNLDGAIRSWAAEDKDVAAVVAAVDLKRIAHIEKLLVEAGVRNELARHRAFFLYWAYVGHPLVRETHLSSLSPLAVDDISHLFQA
jgi:AcrR family transcriptional regulator